MNDPKTIAKLLRAVASGEEAKASKHDLIFKAAADLLDSNQNMKEALEHAKARFQCLADEFKGDECNVNWAMCSVDAERMDRALPV